MFFSSMTDSKRATTEMHIATALVCQPCWVYCLFWSRVETKVIALISVQVHYVSYRDLTNKFGSHSPICILVDRILPIE